MKNNVEQLLTDHKKLIEDMARKNAQFVPLTVAQIEAYRIAREAAEKYDANSGVKFSTFLTQHLQKLQRLSTQFGGLVRIPENKQFKIQKINMAEKHLSETLGRPATVAELADATGFGIPAVNGLLSVRKKEVNMTNLSHTPVFTTHSKMDDWIHFVYHDLSDIDKLIFEYKTGFGGKPTLQPEQIANKLNIPLATVTQRISLITKKLSEKKF